MIVILRCRWELFNHDARSSAERTASQIYRVTQRLNARSRRACPERSRRNPDGAYLTHAARSFSTTEPREQNLPRYALDGHGYIFSCIVIIFHPQICARSLNSVLIVRMRLSFFSRRQPLSCFFPSDGGANVFVTFKIEEALAAAGRSKTFHRALLMLHDAQIEVAGDANVKRACMAAENVDVAAGHSKMLAVFVLGARERPWRVHQEQAPVVESSEQQG
jgi:hypothetical protein